MWQMRTAIAVLALVAGAAGAVADSYDDCVALAGTDPARLKAEAGNCQGAADDLDAALARGTPDAGLLVLRASARRHLGDRKAAAEDLRQAADIPPHLPSVWLERGALVAESGDADAARAAWLKAIELDRDRVVGEAVRLRIQRLEAGGG